MSISILSLCFYPFVSQLREVDISLELMIEDCHLNTIYQIMLEHIVINLTTSHDMDITIAMVFTDMSQTQFY